MPAFSQRRKPYRKRYIVYMGLSGMRSEWLALANILGFVFITLTVANKLYRLRG